MYCSFALAGHRGTCLRPLHIFALLCFFLDPILLMRTRSRQRWSRCGFLVKIRRLLLLLLLLLLVQLNFSILKTQSR